MHGLRWVGMGRVCLSSFGRLRLRFTVSLRRGTLGGAGALQVGF